MFEKFISVFLALICGMMVIIGLVESGNSKCAISFGIAVVGGLMSIIIAAFGEK